jgi:Tol biopolymer transport system component
MMRRTILALTVSTLAASAVFVGAETPAQATFPVTDGRIVFDSGRGGNGNLYTMNSDGTDVTQLTFYTSAQGAAGPQAVSPDGEEVVYQFNNGLYLINANGTDQRVLLSEPTLEDIEPSFSPDGRLVIFSRCIRDFAACSIWTITTDGRGLTPLTTFDRKHEVFDQNAVYSPDGRTIAFWSLNRNGLTDAIYLMDANGRNIRAIAPTIDLEGWQPDWSPNGSTIAFNSDCCGSTPSQIWTVQPNGSDLTQLTQPPTHNVDPSWSPSGDKIAFTSYSADLSTVSIDTMNPDGSDQTTLQSGPDSDAYALNPAWGAAPSRR